MKCYMTGKPCDYYKADVSDKRMFVIFPFCFPFDSLYGDNGRIQDLLKVNCRVDHVNRSDQTLRLGSIMCQGICKQIIESPYIYADISVPNPNVYYELGLAYALSRKLVVLKNSTYANDSSGIFTNAWNGKGTYREYADLLSLYKTIQELKAEDPISLPRENHACNKRQVLVLENGNGGIGMLYQTLLEQQQTEFDFEDLLKTLSASEKKSFSETEWKKWTVSTLRVVNNTDLMTIIDRIRNSKICVVDTTAYPSAAGPTTNPYMYFCLGVAHAFEKEVIPITNTAHSTRAVSEAPFDVKGLWHIFFSKEEELKNGFKEIIPRISIEFHKELSAAPYRLIWDDFLTDKPLSVIYCGRPIAGKEGELHKKYENRGPRTNVDSQDTKAVSEVSFYLAQKYPTSVIKPASPKTKMETVVPEKVEEIRKELRGVYSNCIIIGSPDVNDYAEVVLAELYGVDPFRTSPSVVKHGGFVFHKNNIKDVIHSAFYTKDSKNRVEHSGATDNCDDHTTFGVLVIARNPFVEKAAKSGGKVMVLSGFTGIATCGLMELVIESEAEARSDRDDEVMRFKQALREQLENEICQHYDRDLARPFTAIVRFEYHNIKEEQTIGENRQLHDVKVLHVFPKDLSRSGMRKVALLP
jgi:hypothetical protein